MITSMIRTMTSSMVSSMIPSDVESRVFIDFDNVLNAHCVMSTPIIPAGNFSVSFEFSTTSVISRTIVSGDNLNTDVLVIDVTAAGVRAFAYVGGVIQTIITSSSANDGKLHTGEFTYTGATAELFLDGASQGTETWALDGNQVISRIGARGDGSNDYLGILANISINDIDAGVTTTFRLSEETANFELPVENVFGGEEIVNNIFDDTTGWVSTRAGASSISVAANKLRATANSTSTFGQVTTLTGLVIGEAYFVQASVLSSSPSLNVRFRAATDSALSTNVIALGTELGGLLVDAVFTATATTMYAGTVNTGGSNGVFTDIEAGISIKQVTNAITYVNIPESIRDTYTLVDDGVNWIGSENIPQPLDFVGDWTDVGGVNVTAANAFITTSSGGQGVYIDHGLVNFARITYSIAAGDANWQLRDSETGALEHPLIKQAGSANESGVIDYNSTQGGLYVRHFDTDAITVTANELSIKRRIEIA